MRFDIFNDRGSLHYDLMSYIYLPEVNYPQFYLRMKKIMGLNDYNAAKAEVESLANWLSTISCDAEASLREARDEILTVHLIGMTGEFRKSLSSTNLIESLIGVVKNKMRNVKKKVSSENKRGNAER